MPAPIHSALAASGMLLLLGCAGSVDAAGIGKAKVLSLPGQPLRVRVELILGPGDRPSRIKAAVASPAIPEDDESNQLWVTVDPAPYGRAALTVRSIAPVAQSNLELEVAVRSPAGQAYRSFDIRVPQAAPPGEPPAPAAPAPAEAPRPDRAIPEAAVPEPPAAVAAPPSFAAPPPPSDAPTATDHAGNAGARLQEQAALGRLVSLVALGVALLAAAGALILLVLKRR